MNQETIHSRATNDADGLYEFGAALLASEPTIPLWRHRRRVSRLMDSNAVLQDEIDRLRRRLRRLRGERDTLEIDAINAETKAGCLEGEVADLDRALTVTAMQRDEVIEYNRKLAWKVSRLRDSRPWWRFWR